MLRSTNMRKYLVVVEGKEEEAKAESTQQLAELYQGMGIDDFKIIRDLGSVENQQETPDLSRPIELTNSDGSHVPMLSIDDLPSEYQFGVNLSEYPVETPVKVEKTPEPVQQNIEKVWKDGEQEFMLKNGELHKRCWRETTLKELEEKLGCKINITDSKNIQIQDWEKLGD